MRLEEKSKMADGGHVFLTDRFFFFVVFFFFCFVFLFCTCTTRHRVEHSDQDLKENPTSGLGGDAITSLSMGNFTKSEPGTKRPNLSTDRNFFLFLYI